MLGMLLGSLWFGGTPAREETGPGEPPAGSGLTFTARLPAAENASTLSVEDILWPGPTEPTQEDLKCLRSWDVCQMSSHPADMLARGVVQPLVLEIHVGGMRLNGEEVLVFREGRVPEGESEGLLLTRLNRITRTQHQQWREMLGLPQQNERGFPTESGATALLVVDEAVPFDLTRVAMYSIGQTGIGSFAFLVRDPQPVPALPPPSGAPVVVLQIDPDKATLSDSFYQDAGTTQVTAPGSLPEAGRSLLEERAGCAVVVPDGELLFGTTVQYLDALATLGAKQHVLAGGSRQTDAAVQKPASPPESWSLSLSEPLSVFRTGVPRLGPGTPPSCGTP